MLRRYKKCYCMNNSYKNDSCEMQADVIEKQCDNVVSYEDYMDERRSRCRKNDTVCHCKNFYNL